MSKLIFTPEERKEAMALGRSLKAGIGTLLKDRDEERMFEFLKKALRSGAVERDVFGLNPILTGLQTAKIAVDEIGLRRDGVIAILLYAVTGATA